MLIKALGLAVLFAVSLQGWGWLCRRAFRLECGGWPATIALGLAATVFLGGILNLARLAVPGLMLGLVIVGASLSMVGSRRKFSGFAELRIRLGERGTRNGWGWVAVYLIAAAILWFTIQTQLPPRAYNYHDDFQKYFSYPVRMLETGTLFGSPLSAIGLETLGGEAFLHGFVILALPFSYLNGLDGVFGLFLCLALATRFTGGRRDQLVAAAACLLSVVFINPQYVNISALYLGSALIMTAILLSSHSGGTNGGTGDPIPNRAAMGLLYAAMIALKTSFVLFAALHLFAVAIAIYFSTRKARQSARWSIVAAAYCAVFLSPWLLLHAPHYLAAMKSSQAVAIAQAGRNPTETVGFLSTRPLFYGATTADYSGLVAAVGLAGLLAVWAAARSDDRRLRLSAGMTAAAAAAGVAAYLVVMWAPLGGYEMSLRYFTPFAIGIAPAVFGLTAFHLARSERSMPRTLRLGLPLLAASGLAAAFLPSLGDRAKQAVDAGSVLAFSDVAESPAYILYNRKVLDGPVRDAVSTAQSKVPAGEPFVAWIDTPFYLNFSRNPIADVDVAGLATGWAAMPPVRYVIWEYGGFATRHPSDYTTWANQAAPHERMIAVRGLDFALRLEELARTGEVLYNDGEIIVFRVTEKMVHP